MTEDMTIAEKMDLLKKIDELELHLDVTLLELSNKKHDNMILVTKNTYYQEETMLLKEKYDRAIKQVDDFKSLARDRGTDIRYYRREIYELKEKVRTLEEELKHVDSQSE